jgi:amino acid transporter
LKLKNAATETTGTLKKSLGFTSLFAVAIGAVTSQSSFVSLLNGTGQGGSAFLVALLLAFVLTLCYCFTFLELSLMMPRAGGMGTYTAVSAGHFISIGVVLGGYVAVVPFSGPAELLLLEKIVNLVYPGTFAHLGLALLLLFTVLNLLGIDIFSSVQNLVVYTLLVALLVIGITGVTGAKPSEMGISEIGRELTASGGTVLSLMVLALWSFAGLEFMCPFIEETKNPQKNLPRTMLLGAVMLLLVYGLLAIAALRNVSPESLASSETPHWLLVESVFGKSAGFVMVVFAITATSCVTNTVIAGIPRMMYGMARQGQLPAIFGRLHPRWKSPWYGIVAVFLLVCIPLVLLAGAKDFILLMLISAATFWLVAYIVAHINVIVLRKRYPGYARPFCTPIYPLPQVLGILGMGLAIWYNSPSEELSRQVYINSALMFTLISGYAFFWVRFKMKKGLLDAEPIDEALSE